MKVKICTSRIKHTVIATAIGAVTCLLLNQKHRMSTSKKKKNKMYIFQKIEQFQTS